MTPLAALLLAAFSDQPALAIATASAPARPSFSTSSAGSCRGPVRC